jgi:predicted PurR-regulated permease PerM
MLGVDPRTFKVVWTIFLFGLLIATVYAVRETLILLAVAIFFAYMLAPLVNLVERITPRRRGIALAIVYVLLVGGLVTAGVTLGSQIADEATSFAGHLPGLVKQSTLQTFPLPDWIEPLRAKIITVFQHEAAQLQASIVPFLQHASGQIVSGITFLVLIVLVPILSFFLLKDAREINAFLVQILGVEGDQTLIRQILDDIDVLLSKYIRALVLLSFIAFAAWGLFLSIMHAPYQLLLAGISGALEFLPGIGPAISLALLLIVCGISGFTGGLLWIVVFWVGLRLFQDYVVNPLLMSAGVQLHPLLVLLAILAGGHIGGVPGLFFSVPVMAILKVIFIRSREAQLREALAHRRIA